MAATADIFAKHGVSVKSVTQRPRSNDDGLPEEAVDLVFVTHTAQEGSVRKVIDDILALRDVVLGGFPSVIRVED